MYCRNCGVEVTLPAKFCSNCGVALARNEASRTPIEGATQNAEIENIIDVSKKRSFKTKAIGVLSILSILALGIFGLSQNQIFDSSTHKEFLVSELGRSCLSLNDFARLSDNWKMVAQSENKEIYSLFGDTSGPTIAINLLSGEPQSIKISTKNYDITNDFLYFANCPSLVTTPKILSKSKPNTSPSRSDTIEKSKNEQLNQETAPSKKNWQDFQACLESNSYLSATQAKEMCYEYNPNSLWGD